MSETGNQSTFVLPPSVVTKVDISRLISEMQQLDNDIITRDARMKAGATITDELTLSEPLQDFLAANSLEVGETNERAELINRLRQFKSSAPVVHVTFAAPVDLESLRVIAAWLREKVHPQSVVSVGLQPSLIGGIYIRTPNHIHDFSIRAQLAGHRDIIISEVEALRGSK